METDLNKEDSPANEGEIQPEAAPDFLASQNQKEGKGQRQKHGHPKSDFVPHHSDHGRSNHRTFGANHEPGTIV